MVFVLQQVQQMLTFFSLSLVHLLISPHFVNYMAIGHIAGALAIWLNCPATAMLAIAFLDENFPNRFFQFGDISISLR